MSTSIKKPINNNKTERERFYIIDYHQFLTDNTVLERDLKAILKENYDYTARRMSRLTILALIGALKFKPPVNTGIYTSSSFSSPSSMHALMLKTYRDKSAHPFGFINSIHNALPFFIAQSLAVNGPNIFVSSNQSTDSWVQPILLALSDLQANKIDSALVGWVHEYKNNGEHSTKEGAHFILISKASENASHQMSFEQSNTLSIMDNAAQADQYFYQSVEDFIGALVIGASIKLEGILNNTSLLIESPIICTGSNP